MTLLKNPKLRKGKNRRNSKKKSGRHQNEAKVLKHVGEKAQDDVDPVRNFDRPHGYRPRAADDIEYRSYVPGETELELEDRTIPQGREEDKRHFNA